MTANPEKVAPLVELKNVRKHYPRKGGIFSRDRGYVKAVENVSLSISRGETLALVGESGCGKSTLGRLALALEKPTGGTVFFHGNEIFSHRKNLEIRKKMQVVFQDPYSSLDPRITAGGIIAEGLKIHGTMSKAERKARVEKLLKEVGIDPGQANQYPHQFSGGQRQRIAIARALAVEPELIICDEPTSALDVSVQGQVLNLLKNLQKKTGIAFLFITHDLAVVRQVADRVVVMYMGETVEKAPVENIFESPVHPYTKLLMKSVLKTGKKKNLPATVARKTGHVPDSGCAFRPRCENTVNSCAHETPKMEKVAPGHYAACHLIENLSRKSQGV